MHMAAQSLVGAPLGIWCVYLGRRGRPANGRAARAAPPVAQATATSQSEPPANQAPAPAQWVGRT